MLKPSVQVREQEGLLLAEFWDCLRLDPAPIQDLRKAFEAHVRRGGRPVILVDMTGVGFAGSSALGGFLALRRLGARVIFYQVEPNVLEVFRVSKLLSLFGFEADRDAALAAASRGEPAPDAAAGRSRDSSTPPLRRLRDRPKDPEPGA